MPDVAKLRQCGLNYELHHNGFLEQWPEKSFLARRHQQPACSANQYGRTSFLFAGVPGMQLPVSFHKDPAATAASASTSRCYNASIFSLYLPIANVADIKRGIYRPQLHGPEFYHTLLMSNHMESDPEQFADGIRGKTLWHNEYRTQKMYEAASQAQRSTSRPHGSPAPSTPTRLRRLFTTTPVTGATCATAAACRSTPRSKLDKRCRSS